jgi:HK97 family phage major capsid protein
MSAVYNTKISRDESNDPLVPTPVAAQVIQEAAASSFVMTNARRVTMSSKTDRLPVLSTLPQAYWVSGDDGLKQTTTQDWENVTLTAEEAAVIIPVPEAYISDSQVPIWDEVRPRLAEAVAKLVDDACLFGTGAPASFTSNVYGHAIAAGNAVVKGAGTTKMWQNVARLGELVHKDGFSLNGFAGQPGFQWELIQEADGESRPIYDTAQAALYGQPYFEVRSGGFDTSDAKLIGGDWSKAIVGMRQDISFKIFDQGVISDGSGNVVLNLMQQDSVAIRCVIRLGFAIANPATKVNETKATRSPFAVLQETTAAS